MVAGTVTLIAIAVVAAVVVLWVIGIYNSLVRLRNLYRNAFAQIDVQLKRRHDLIPNLVEVAKRYMAHERDTLEAVIAARNSAENARGKVSTDDAGSMKQLVAAEQGLGGALGRLFALSEAYPDLKANQNMMQLTEELTTTENKVSFARQAYNDAVMHYNNRREVFPASMVAGMFNFAPASLFELTNEAEREAVKVSF